MVGVGVAKVGPPYEGTRFGPLFVKGETEDEDEALDEDEEDFVNDEP